MIRGELDVLKDWCYEAVSDSPSILISIYDILIPIECSTHDQWISFFTYTFIKNVNLLSSEELFTPFVCTVIYSDTETLS